MWTERSGEQPRAHAKRRRGPGPVLAEKPAQPVVAVARLRSARGHVGAGRGRLRAGAAPHHPHHCRRPSDRSAAGWIAVPGLPVPGRVRRGAGDDLSLQLSRGHDCAGRLECAARAAVRARATPADELLRSSPHGRRHQPLHRRCRNARHRLFLERRAALGQPRTAGGDHGGDVRAQHSAQPGGRAGRAAAGVRHTGAPTAGAAGRAGEPPGRGSNERAPPGKSPEHRGDSGLRARA